MHCRRCSIRRHVVTIVATVVAAAVAIVVVVVEVDLGRSGGRIFFSRVNFLC